jgi:outer membrane protein, heavy metal efflux system
VARADIIEAKQIREPLIQVLLAAGPKRFELLWTQPLDLLIQRPKRIRAAELNVQRLAESLGQNGIDLARDVRAAHAEVC